MPIYEFICNDCGHRFARLFRAVQGSDEGASPPCQACGSANTRRAISQFAVHGPGGADPAEVVAERAAENKLASITSKEQIDAWRSASKK